MSQEVLTILPVFVQLSAKLPELSKTPALLDLPEISLLLPIIGLAFSEVVRKAIGKRDKWHCQGCGVEWNGGYMLHASHLNHSRDKNYNSPDNGEMLCVDCHQAYHEDHIGKASEIGLTEEGNLQAIGLLSTLDRLRK